MRLTLRTLLAYLDDTLPADEARRIGQKVAESKTAQELIATIDRVTRRRGLSTPASEGKAATDPNTVAEYLSDVLATSEIENFENLCLESDVHLAEVAVCHQILTLLLSEPVRVPPSARQRMYRLITGPEALPNKKPSNTLPIGGMMPDETLPASDDSDAGYLLGMKAYGQTESRSQRLAQLLLLGGLVGGLALTAYAAWPTSKHQDVPPNPTDFAINLPKKNPEEPNEKPPVVRLPANPMMPPRAPSLPPDEPVAPAEIPMPNVEKTVKPAAPKTDSIALGRLAAPEKVLLAERDEKWVRIQAVNSQIDSAQRLMALPGYHAGILLQSGVQLTLWGNTPEQVAIPILESSLILHAPEEGFDADLTLLSGRVYLSTLRAKGGTVRIRFRSEIWDLTLPNPECEAVVELSNRLTAGLMVDTDPNEKSQTHLTLAVLKSQARLKASDRPLLTLATDDSASWSSTDIGFVGPKRLAAVEVAALARIAPNPNEPLAKAVQQLLAEFAENFRDVESARVRFDELLADTPAPPDESRLEAYKRTLRPSFAVLGHSAIRNLGPVVDGLKDERRAPVRDDAVYGLVSLLASAPEQVSNLQKVLVEKHRLSEEQARVVVRLLRGPTMTERTDPRALDFLGDCLASPVLHIREVAYWQLLNTVDPEARSMKPLTAYDAGGTPETRDGATKVWKRRIEELKK